MLRREFLGALPIVAAGAADGRVGNGQLDAAAPQIYEWRQYSLRTGMQPRRVADYLQNALIPALNRLGHSPVGVFEVTFGLPTPTVFVLTPFASADAFLTKEFRLDNDETFIKSAAGYFDAVPADAVYVRQEVSVLGAFPRMPRIQVPVATATKGPRLFELRTYESHNDRAGAKKIEMFEKGEFPIFKRAGLTWVFFGKNVVGAGLPSLTYMLVFPNLAAYDKAWATFREDPEWVKLRGLPEYADIVSTIHNALLRPTDYSQI